MLPSSNRVEAAEECMKAQTPTRSDSETVCVESTLLSNLCLRYHQTQHLSSEEIFPCIQDCTTQEVKEIADRMKGANWSSRRAVWSVVDEIPHVWRDWVWPKAVRLEELLMRNWVREGVGVGEEGPNRNYSTVLLFKVMQGHRSLCWITSRGNSCE